MSISISDPDTVLTPQHLWQAWPEERFVKSLAPCLRHGELVQNLQALASRYGDGIELQEVGRSFLGRSIKMLTLGVGHHKILFWSQMHGNEPSATPALLDMADYLLRHADQAAVRSVLESYTLLLIPMLNPDGAEIYERCNAQGIDINRDALQLATPEGRILKRIRDEYEPMLGLNLHDQGRMTTVGDSGQLATISLLAVSGDAESTLTRGRLRAKRACAAIVEALAPQVPGGLARYDEGWSPRAFGDNITAWGTPVVLIETGGFPAGYDVSALTRLNFVALLCVLGGLAENDLASFDPQIYESLPENQTDAWSDVVVRGGLVQQPGHKQAFRADLSFNYQHNGRQAAGCCGQTLNPSLIFMLGDAACHAAGTSVDAHDKILLAAFDVGVDGWEERRWMNRDQLKNLARLGVGAVYWIVEESKNLSAQRVADSLAIQGAPRIEVCTKPDRLPKTVLTGPPLKPASATLGATLTALGVETSSGIDALAGMWMNTADRLLPARLCKDQPATFLIVSPGQGGQIDLQASKLLSTWLDGHQVA